MYFLYRGYRDPRYFRNFMERLGSLPNSYKRTAPGAVWLHAVSVGEAVSCVRLVAELRAANPAIPIYVSTATLTGRATAEEKLSNCVDGIFYAPIDYTFAIRRVLRRIRPAVVVILETEIWPNLYREIKLAGCSLLIVNGRISNRAFPSYRRFKTFFQPALAYPDAIYAQSETDRARYIAIGAPPERTQVFGNLKYDAAPSTSQPPQVISDLIAVANPQPVWIAASVMPPAASADVDETAAVLDAFEKLAPRYPRSLLILAPRKPDRFDQTAAALAQRGISCARRSQLTSAGATALHLPAVLLLDTIGELASLFPLADAVFMGGTLARRGGHNILEPAFASRPIVIGPHMENFAAIADEFRAAAAVVEIDSPAQLADAIAALFEDPPRRAELGRRARDLAASKRGVTARAVREILASQDSAVPSWRLRGVRKSLTGWLSLLWQWGGALKKPQPRSLATPVVSVGGISMGGVGKTPFVLMLAARLRARGLQPAILTRGYRRRSLAKTILVEAAASAPAAMTGDEAQIFVRSSISHVGIAADRFAAGRAIEEKLHADVFLLDDGFQHRRLARNLDIVLIDALDPFAGGAVFPRGRLREPPHALSRADIVVLTRAQPGRQYRGIRERLHQLNAAAPLFLARVEPKRWIDAFTGQETAQPAGPVGAFCGLGNPHSYWETLRTLGIAPAFTWAFGDHHVYKPRELRRLASQARGAGATALVTTQKDIMNLPGGFASLLAPVPLYWLEIETTVDNERLLLDAVERALAAKASLRVSSPPAS